MKKNVFIVLLMVGIVCGGIFLSGVVDQNRTLRERNEKLACEVTTLEQEKQSAVAISRFSSPAEVLRSLQQIARVTSGMPEKKMQATGALLYSVSGSLQLGEEFVMELAQSVMPVMMKQLEYIKAAQERDDSAGSNEQI